MQTRKQSIGRLELGVLCSLSSSYMLLPFLIFSGLLTGKSTAVNLFVPVVILYSIQRACLIALRGFGEITNPYRTIRPCCPSSRRAPITSMITSSSTAAFRKTSRRESRRICWRRLLRTPPFPISSID